MRYSIILFWRNVANLDVFHGSTLRPKIKFEIWTSYLIVEFKGFEFKTRLNEIVNGDLIWAICQFGPILWIRPNLLSGNLISLDAMMKPIVRWLHGVIKMLEDSTQLRNIRFAKRKVEIQGRMFLVQWLSSNEQSARIWKHAWLLWLVSILFEWKEYLGKKHKSINNGYIYEG